MAEDETTQVVSEGTGEGTAAKEQPAAEGGEQQVDDPAPQAPAASEETPAE